MPLTRRIEVRTDPKMQPANPVESLSQANMMID